MRHATIAPENDNPSKLNRSLSSRSSNSGSEIIKQLKLQIAQQQEKLHRQQEKLDMQSSQLRRTQAECEALKTENESLLNELAATGIGEEEQQSSSTSDGASSRWFPRRRGSTNSPASSQGGSMQLLIDTNAKLMMANKRLNAECTNIRQSFQQYIVDNGNGESSKKKSISKNKKDKQRDSGHNLSIENIHRVVKESTSRHKKSTKNGSNRSEASRSTAKTSIADSSVDQDEVRSLGKTVPTKPKYGKHKYHSKASLTASQEFATSVDSLGWHSSWAELENSIRGCER